MDRPEAVGSSRSFGRPALTVLTVRTNSKKIGTSQIGPACVESCHAFRSSVAGTFSPWTNASMTCWYREVPNSTTISLTTKWKTRIPDQRQRRKACACSLPWRPSPRATIGCVSKLSRSLDTARGGASQAEVETAATVAVAARSARADGKAIIGRMEDIAIAPLRNGFLC